MAIPALDATSGSINGREVNVFVINEGPLARTIEMEAFADIIFNSIPDVVLHFDVFFESDADIRIEGDTELGKLFFGGDYGRRMVLPSEPRTVFVPAYEQECATMSDCCLATYTKDPADLLDYNVDFGQWLEVEDLVDAAVVALEKTDTAIVIDLVEVSRQVVRVWLKAGLDGEDSHVEVMATTTDGRVKTACFRIRIKECC